MKTLKAVIVVLAISFSGFASAGVIEFEYTGTGSGSIGGQAFTDSFFTITEYSNTDDLQSCSATCRYIDAISTTITIDNIGVFDFVSGTRTFVNNGLLGLSRAGQFGSDLYYVFDIGSYDLLSALDTVVKNVSFLQWNRTPSMITNGGTLIFNDGDATGTFQARLNSPATVTEPTTLAIFAFGLMGLAARRFKKV
ncbi:PEP-CTERM sorting domain-containing protein [Agarivorans sp. B2Z047]|uniref:PEP-CTERM sorting domain-containing protein n=1 Tax=Agarivorans sp. B2Z047 TaxID=2652721 RepID=UPI00128B96E6|nr:PEP-CTERM sorting domain-containing protein [Agarivorans sp. B2Z047]MPW29268.1 PEP-CTERM sorting domain-containing protein [Agarivorans sp. B2Z047]UQN41821.1 PEP-CTERM sorting domain-containing protein [Agarivorans sp. B2Z047]